MKGSPTRNARTAEAEFYRTSFSFARVRNCQVKIAKIRCKTRFVQVFAMPGRDNMRLNCANRARAQRHICQLITPSSKVKYSAWIRDIAETARKVHVHTRDVSGRYPQKHIDFANT